MEKSIESIWKNGFLNKEALVAPKLNDLNNRKSNHIIDKYKRMFRINLKAIFIGSFVVLLASFLVRIPWMGVPMFFLLQWLVFADRKLLKDLEKIDKTGSSYDYLKRFGNWMQRKSSENATRARLLYPCIFLSMLAGFWFMKFNGTTLGNKIVEWLTIYFPDTYILFGFPAVGLLLVLIGCIVLALLGKKLYQWDINMVYGPIMNKLEELIADMEELRT